jgi:predicted Zn finger-like uncharacterized protein
LYTQCPDCATVFRVTADALRAAQGTVRCGICSSSFNAIEYLNEQPIPRQSEEQAFDDTITVEEVPGTEFIELSDAAADRTSERPDAAPEFLREVQDPDPDQAGDADLEFHGSVQDLDRLFVPAEPRPLWPPPAGETGGREQRLAEADKDLDEAIRAIANNEFSGIEVLEQRIPQDLEHWDTHPGQIAAVLAFPPAAVSAAAGDEEVPDASAEAARDHEPPALETTTEADDGIDDPDRTDEHPIIVLDEHGEIAGSSPGGEPGVAPDPAHGSSAEDELAEQPEADFTSSADSGLEATAAGETVAGETEVAAATTGDETLLLLIPEELRRESAASAASAFEPAAESVQAPRRWPWFVAAGLLLFVLAAQAVHFWRDDLSHNPAVGPWLMGAYAALGIPLAPPADLAAFELRQLGAASDGLQAGRIKLRASVVNRAAFAQPLPVLRLSLQDRFGSTIGTRDLEPAEYLPGGAGPPSGLLAPSQRADAEVVFVDPGRDAVGFELDVCLHEASGVRCSASETKRP